MDGRPPRAQPAQLAVVAGARSGPGRRAVLKNPWYSSSEVRMNRRLFGVLGVVAVFTLTVGSCKSDPFADVHGTPTAVVTNFSYLQLPIGTSATVQASIVDATATPLEVPITFTPCTGDVTVAVDTSYHPIPKTSSRGVVTAVTANPSCIVVAGGGVKDTVQVAVLPQGFAGTFSSATPKGGDTL